MLAASLTQCQRGCLLKCVLVNTGSTIISFCSMRKSTLRNWQVASPLVMVSGFSNFKWWIGKPRNLKLTANAPENGPGPKRKLIFQPSIFKGKLALSFREGFLLFLPNSSWCCFFFVPQLAVFECRFHAVEVSTPNSLDIPQAIPHRHTWWFGGLSLEALKNTLKHQEIFGGFIPTNPHHVFGCLGLHYIFPPGTPRQTIYKWLFQLDDSKSFVALDVQSCLGWCQNSPGSIRYTYIGDGHLIPPGPMTGILLNGII